MSFDIKNQLLKSSVGGHFLSHKNINTTIDKVAGPVGEALIMTALGLAVAIPAVLGYNALARVNRNILLRLQRFALDLQAYFSGEENKS